MNWKIEIVFQSFPLDHEAKYQLIKDINSIGEISIPEKAIDTWASFPLSYLENKIDLEKFINIFDKIFTEILNS